MSMRRGCLHLGEGFVYVKEKGLFTFRIRVCLHLGEGVVYI